MAISNRVKKNSSGQVMVPMNLEGTSYDQNFMNTTKLIVLAGMVLLTILACVKVHSMRSGFARFLGYLLVVFVDQLILRKIVFQENYYAQIYKKSQQYNITTPNVFWNVPNIQDTYKGAVLLFADGRTGVIFRAERDTIVGKAPDFMEAHYDAVSDFYKAVNQHRLNLVQLDIMEPAGKDPRINTLDSLVTAPSNRNLSKLMEMQIGEIRKTTRETLYETEYFLIYSREGMANDKLIAAAQECAIQLLNGAYIRYTMLDKLECTELVKELYGVQYFDYGRAAVSVFKNTGVGVSRAFEIKKIRFSNGTIREIDITKNIRLSNLARYVLKGDLKQGEWTIRDALDGKIRNTNNFAKPQPVGKKAIKGTDKAVEEVGSVFLDLDDDEYVEFAVEAHKDEKSEPVQESVKSEKSKRRWVGIGKKKGVSADKKKSRKVKKGKHGGDTEDKILGDSQENFQPENAVDIKVVRSPDDDDEIIDI